MKVPNDRLRLWIGRNERRSVLWRAAVEEAGGETRSFALTQPVPLHFSSSDRQALGEWERYRWILFSSQAGVDCTLECRGLRPDPPDLSLGSVGPATSQALRRRGLAVRLEAPSANGDSLAKAFLALDLVPMNTPVLLPTARGGRPELRQALSRAGFPLTVVETHESRPLPGPPPPPGVAILLSSPSAVRALGDRVNDPARQAIWAIGPTTANAARRAGFPVVRVLPEPTPKALKELLVR